MWGPSKNRMEFIEIQLAANDPNAMQMQVGKCGNPYETSKIFKDIKPDSYGLAQIGKPTSLSCSMNQCECAPCAETSAESYLIRCALLKKNIYWVYWSIHRSNHLSISIYLCLRIHIDRMKGRIQLLFRRVEPLYLWCLCLIVSRHFMFGASLETAIGQLRGQPCRNLAKQI